MRGEKKNGMYELHTLALINNLTIDDRLADRDRVVLFRVDRRIPIEEGQIGQTVHFEAAGRDADQRGRIFDRHFKRDTWRDLAQLEGRTKTPIQRP